MFKSQLGAAFFRLAPLISCAHFGDKFWKLRFFRVIYVDLKGVRSVWKTVVASSDKTIVSTCRFLSSEGIAECERACNKEKPSLQEMSKAALNVSKLKCITKLRASSSSINISARIVNRFFHNVNPRTVQFSRKMSLDGFYSSMKLFATVH